MSSSGDSDRRAARGRLRRRFLASQALIFLLAAHAATNAAAAPKPSAAQSNTRTLITTATGARLRERPDAGSAEVGRLQLGLVVEELERSAEKARVGSAEAFWHRVSAPGGASGWVFGGLVAPFDPARRDETYQRLASERVSHAAPTFPELSELVRFLDRALKEVTRREARAELELTRLFALGRSLASIAMEDLEKPPYKPWLTEHAGEIVYSEPAGQWFVRSELLWSLQRKHAGLPVAERAAWEAAQTPLPGECEGYLPCYIYKETETNGRYLRLYPRGAHAEQALSNLSEFFGHVTEDLRGGNPVFEVPRVDRPSFRKSVAALRAQLALVPAAGRARVVAQLDEIARRFR
ncbi:MAG: SH3 domain-containing protein [Acidobacteria bacterium]|nr:SH3 domain-containing protein [Acidobacteriota bacterium]